MEVELLCRVVSLVLAAGFWMAQGQQAVDQKPADQNSNDQQAEDQQSQDQLSQGPSILSRDTSLVSQPPGRVIDFRYYAEITGIYDTGLVPLTTNAQGNLVNAGAASGVETGFGIQGTRRWKRNRLSLEYKGAYRKYSTNAVVEGLDEFLNLRYSHEISRRLTLDLKETVGSVSLSNGAFSYLPLTSTDLFALPANELFDIRTRFAQSRVDLTWRKSERLSFSVGGEGFVVRRSSFLLAGLDGYDAHAMVAYRLTRHQTVSADYDHTYFDFERTFGNARLQSASLGYSVALNRRWEMSLRGGGVRINALGIMQVPISPAIAAILGVNYANVTFNATTYAPLEQASLTRNFERASLTFSYLAGATPGNGLYLTSRQATGSTAYTYTGYRRWTFGVHGGYGELSAIGQNLGAYSNVEGGAGATYRVGRETHIQLRYDYRHYTIHDSIYQKDSSRVSLGLAFSPGETPLRIW